MYYIKCLIKIDVILFLMKKLTFYKNNRKSEKSSKIGVFTMIEQGTLVKKAKKGKRKFGY